MLLLAVAMVAGCGLSAIGGLVAWWLERHLPTPSSAPRYAYWSDACFSSDEKLMAAGGAGFAVLDLANGKVVGRGTEDVFDVVCSETGAVVQGYQATWTWPGGLRGPVMERNGKLKAGLEDGTRVWVASSYGRDQIALLLKVEQGGRIREIELGPRDFGEVGRARDLPTAKSFGVTLGGVLRNRRLLLVSGWSPNRAGAWVEPVSWGFFSVNVDDGRVEPLRAPIGGDASVNLARLAVVRASADERTLAMATSNGSSAVVAIYGGLNPQPVRATLSGWDEVSRLAVAPDGSRVALASAFHGQGSPARIVVLESRHGRQVWNTEIPTSVHGLALLSDGSLLWASSAREAARVALSDGGSAWRTVVD